MSTPVVTEKWAGNFDCSVCRRKRLVGEEFSKKALEKYRKTGGQLRCKQCMQQQEEKERQAAAAKRLASSSGGATNNETDSSSNGGVDETLQCKACQKELTAGQFNKNQWSKGAGKARCRECVEKALLDEKQQQASSQASKMQAAKDKVAQANASKNPAAILRAESEMAALEAEIVTGLKPIRMNRGSGGRGRGGGRSSGRGRGGRR